MSNIRCPFCGCSFSKEWTMNYCPGCGSQINNNKVKTEYNRMYTHKSENNTNPTIDKVHFNPPVTVVLWSDKTKTIVRCQEGDVFDPEKGLAMAISKKYFGNKGNYCEVFKKWCPEEEKKIDEIRHMEEQTMKGFQDDEKRVVKRCITCKHVNIPCFSLEPCTSCGGYSNWTPKEEE